MSRPNRRAVVLLMLVALISGCSSATPSSSPTTLVPSSTQTPGPISPPVVSTASPPAVFDGHPAAPSTATPAPSGGPADPFLDAVVVTVSDELVVRSEPRVSDDSIMYKPWLPLGTELYVLGGPVSGSGYTWYKVAPVSFGELEGPGYGWVAMAGKDGEPWIALAKGPTAGADLAMADVPRAPANPADAKTAAASVNAFGLDLFRQLLADPELGLASKNAVFSPASIALALGMARAGAKSETATQMDKVLHTSGWDALGPGLNSLDQALASRDATWKDEEGTEHALALRIANAAYGQRGFAIERLYLDTIAAVFGAGLRLVDFVADPEAARKVINAWVSEQTKKRIPELLGQGAVDTLTRLVLVNAIYMKAEWVDRFWESDTKLATFTRLDGSPVGPTMRRQQTWPYAKGTGWQATEFRTRVPRAARPSP